MSRVESLHSQLQMPAVILDTTGVGKAAVEVFQRSGFDLSSLTLMAGDQMVQDGRSYRIPKRDVISTTQVLLQTGRLTIAPSLSPASLLARELVNVPFKEAHDGPEDALDWREGPDDDLVLALAIATWEAERNPRFRILVRVRGVRAGGMERILRVRFRRAVMTCESNPAGGSQGFDQQNAVNCCDEEHNEEEGNYGKLLRILQKDFPHRLAEVPRQSHLREYAYTSFCSQRTRICTI